MSVAEVIQFPVSPLTRGQLTPQQLAHDFINQAELHLGLRYVYWRQQWWVWNKIHYSKLSNDEFRSHLSVFLEGWLPKRAKDLTALTRRLVGDVQAVVQSRLTQGDSLAAPFSLQTGDACGHHVTLQNGVLDVEALTREEETAFSALSPEWFSTNSLPFFYAPGAACPKFLDFLTQIFENDPERIQFVQEWIGWCCVYDYSFQHALVLVGEGANGKGVLSKVIEALLGEDNVSHVPLERFGKQFQLTGTVGKLVNMAPEMNTIDKSDEEQLKSITGGDRIAIDVKYKEGLDVRMTARCIFSTNSIPPFFDRSGGLQRRLIILPFNKVVPEAQRVAHLERQFLPELAGIFNWAIQGLKRLRDRGSFEVPVVCQQAVTRHMKNSNPARTFLEDECQLKPDVGVATMDLYAHYVEWFKEHGYARNILLSQPQFAQEVARVHKIEGKLIRAMGERKRYYPGLFREGCDMVTV